MFLKFKDQYNAAAFENLNSSNAEIVCYIGNDWFEVKPNLTKANQDIEILRINGKCEPKDWYYIDPRELKYFDQAECAPIKEFEIEKTLKLNSLVTKDNYLDIIEKIKDVFK